MQECKHCQSKNVKIGYAFKSNGQRVFPYYCEDCGTVHTYYVKKVVALKIGYELKQVKFKSELNGYFNLNKCAVCGNSEVELHHFAPYHLFGSEASKWPVAYLCKEHHKQWHDVVTPNMCNKK